MTSTPEYGRARVTRRGIALRSPTYKSISCDVAWSMRSGLATGFNVFDLLPWDILPTSLKGSMEVATNLHGSFHGSRFISMEEKLSR